MTDPLLLSTWPFAAPAHSQAWPALRDGGAAVDAVEAVCRHVELDPEVDSVGYGGLPDAAGRVSLDGCLMLSPARLGSAIGLRRHLHPVSIARRVMEDTRHVMLAGPEADDFADASGFEERELLSPRARERWRERGRHRAGGAPEGHDTICSLALDEWGRLAGACSTSGMAWKLPGRVGDSPIFGAGLYVDPEVGGAAATGTGELVLGLCSSFLVVELLRRGAAPLEALAEALERIRAAHDLGPTDQIGLLALAADGRWAAGALRPGFRAVLSVAAGERLVEPELVLLGEREPG